MTNEPRIVIDFEGMLDELRRRGFTWPALERETTIPVTTLKDYLLNGATPLHPNGEKLIAFYCQVTSTARTDVPTRRKLPSVAQSLR